MANAEEIYRFTLERLAEEGNEQAKLALAMGTEIGRPKNIDAVLRTLQQANTILASPTADKWDSDRSRRNAQDTILEAIILLK